MRLPFPERISIQHAIIFAVLLCTAQLLEGTSAVFSLCCFLFIVIFTIAFNLAGGFTRPSGGYVFFYGVLAVIAGLFWKAVLGEPADSNLQQPLLVIEAELAGITAMLGAVYVSRRFTAKKALLSNLVTERNMYSSAMGCMIVGISLTVILTVLPYENGSALSALGQLNQFLPIAIILATIYQIRSSGGRSSINVVVLASGFTIFAAGCIAFSKQGLFTAPLCWLIAAASQRYKLTLYQVIGFPLLLILMFYYLVPYSQYGRTFVTRSSYRLSKSEAFNENIETSLSLLLDLGNVRQEYINTMKNAEAESTGPAYFDTPQGFMDRLQMLSMDDAIMNETDQNGAFGLWPIIMDFENDIPHFLWRGKPTLAFGNLYAHELGMLAPDDRTTGISFSPVGEAFHLDSWAGVFIVAPMLWIMLFLTFDSVCGDARKSPWGLLAIVVVAHVAPEGMLAGVIYMTWYTTIGIIFAALAAAYIMPLLGVIFAHRRSSAFSPPTSIRSIPRRLPSVR